MKLLNKNFILLWQGQLVSVLGDALYSIALGTWVLQKTGSTALMGAIMAAVSIPQIILGPIGGVVVDRSDRKRLIVIGDMVRGIGMLIISLLAITGHLQAWMLLIFGLIFGSCSSFFNPAMQSVLPDIVPKDKLVKANSMYQMASSGASIMGQSISGLLYVSLGAPVIFLINGISYIISAITELFIQIPKLPKKETQLTFKEDFLQGFRFIFSNKGLVKMLMMAFVVNFLFGINRVMTLPWFMSNEFLGEAKYGILCAFQSGGILIGSLIMSIINIKDSKKYYIYIFSISIFMIFVGMGALINSYKLILGFNIIGFVFQFASNAITNSTLLYKVPSDMRGKVMSTVVTIAMCVSPIGNFVGGYLVSL